MTNDEARQRLVEMMFEALLKKRFSQFSRKYGVGPVLQTWGKVVKGGGIKAFLNERGVNSPPKIVDVLDRLDEYCDLVETTIRTTKRARMGKKDSALRN